MSRHSYGIVPKNGAAFGSLARCPGRVTAFLWTAGTPLVAGYSKPDRVVPLELRSMSSCQLKGPATPQGPRNPIPSIRFTCGAFTPAYRRQRLQHAIQVLLILLQG
jgi:hypothetical protein